MVAQNEDTLAPVKATSAWCSDWRYLILLLALVLPLRAWLLYNTEVAARDSIGFIRYALQFENKPWSAVLLGNHQHPGYPLAIWAVSQPVRALAGTDALTMRISAQLASTLAALALLIPMYFLGKELFDRQIGFWGALLFQYFPVSGHHLSDGISEALFLFLVAMALWRGVVAVRAYRPREFAWCGLWGGLAYFTRPEGALVVLTVGLVLVGMQLVTSWRKRWSTFCACGLSLSAAALAVGSIYFLTTGQFTNKPAVHDIRNFIAEHDAETSRPFGHVGGSSLFGVFIPRTDYFPLRLSRGVRAMAAEFSQGFDYFGWVPAVLALCWGWQRLRRDPGFWIPAGYCLLHGSVLLLLAMVEFYVSDRHMMVLILCGTFYTVAGMRACALRIWAWGNNSTALDRRDSQVGSRIRENSEELRKTGNSEVSRLRLQNPIQRCDNKRDTDKVARTWPTPARLTGMVLLATVLVCLPKTVQRLHGNRAGNHQAGLWLAPQLTEGDVVIDDHAYTHYYAGQIFDEEKRPLLPKGYQPTCYVVVTRAGLDIDKVRKDKEEELRQHAKLVYRWPENRAVEEARVVIYAQPRAMDKNPWDVAP